MFEILDVVLDESSKFILNLNNSRLKVRNITLDCNTDLLLDQVR